MATVAASHLSYPVHVDARPAPDQPSRWLWLVKWVLVVPHVVVLALLWAAFVVLSVVALVSILATGRYPRAIFDFNVGVLRWSWRVAYYSYGALGTDRYPPFTLAEDPGYPAHLDVDYPDHLSRGLVLVKWWLLVLPHYLVLVFFVGVGAEAARRVDGLQWVWEGGLIALLTLIVGVALLVTGMYPRGLYDLLLGLNRWVLRVAAYAGLMTDAYPPFRLDQGGAEELTVVTGAPPPAAPPALGPAAPTQPAAASPVPSAAPAPPTSSWTAGRVLGVVAGAVAVLLGLTGIVAGIPLVMWQSSLRDDGYVTTPTWEIDTAGYAAVTHELVLEGAWLDQGLGDVRLRAVGDDGDIFLGVATARDAAAYLGGVARTVRSDTVLDDVPGDAPAVPPADADIWVASTSGTGPLELVLDPEPGRFVAVVMAADGEAGVHAALDAGVRLPWLGTAVAVILPVGVVLLGLGVVAIVLAVRAASRARREVGQP
ncbi:DUF4389 domain-containing protein [Georgenia satyanarayanai]|uniref:DUF4389 domain-containing protein n=1 Tax=Georgenia satyanarayanai TaxID=860221 RepID=UPI00126514D6|nr:DUF4389 domain-containing protein [Georgenia satyanarayanai]